MQGGNGIPRRRQGVSGVAKPNEKLARADELRRSGMLAEAEQLCREIVEGDAADADAWRLLATILSATGRLDAAAESLERALRLRPNDPDILRQSRSLEAATQYRRAMILASQQKPDEAIAALRRTVAVVPDFAEAHFTLGSLLATRGALDEAIGCFRRTIELDPGKVDAHYNLGLALEKLGKPAEAEPHFRRALALDSRKAAAHGGLAAALREQGRLDEAEASYRAALALVPDDSDTEYNLSGLLLELGRFAEAEACAWRVLAARRDFAPAQYNLAVALADQRKLPEAETAYRRMVELAPNEADGRLGLAGLLLSQGRFAEGWPAYEWRLAHPDSSPAPFTQPRWRGEPLEGRTILLTIEQGFGDAIQFIRYAEMVKQRGARVAVACSAPIERLLATCPGVDCVASRYERLPNFDVQLPLLSLPGVFQTTLETIPAEVPYLFPDAAAVDQWRRELGDEGQLAGSGELKIGIAWQGSRRHKRDHQRSMPLVHFAGIAKTKGVRLYSLQFGDGREQIGPATADWPLVDLGERLGDFHHMAALVKNLDLVITCDSAPAHLAGALAVPVWIALSYVPDWRWLLDRTDSPWYPTARLFRQSKPGDWVSVFAQIEAALAKLLHDRRGA